EGDEGRAQPVFHLAAPRVGGRGPPLGLGEFRPRGFKLVEAILANAEEKPRSPQRGSHPQGLAKRRDGGVALVLQVARQAQALPDFGGRPRLELLFVGFLGGPKVSAELSLTGGRNRLALAGECAEYDAEYDA